MKYRTERFGGEGIRDAAEVMAYETFELGNSDIFDTLSATLLKKHPVRAEIKAMMDELLSEGYIDDMPWDAKVEFFGRILAAVEDVTEKKVRYAL